MNQTETIAPRRASEYLARHRRFREPGMLFDEFWREGELALFFGAAGTGKSVFAVQLADALARGGGIGGFRGTRGRRRVLYVDLRHTDEQFRMRCSEIPGGPKRVGPHHFPRNLWRGRPAQGADICKWIRACVRADGVQAVIVDDLSAVKTTHDGTRETLRLMRGLRELRDELGISILVLAESNEPRRDKPVSETDLGRSRVLCTAADSVFAAGRGRRRADDHYLVQTRSRTSRVRWTWQNAPTAGITRNATGLLAFEFDDRVDARLTEEKRRLICEVVRLQEQEFKTFREIGRQLGISRSWACDLYRRWTPAMESSLAASSPHYKGGVAAASADGVVLSDPAEAQPEVTRDYLEENHPVSPANDAGLPPLPGKEGSLADPRVFQGEGGMALSPSMTDQGETELNSPAVEENHPVCEVKDTSHPPLLGKEGSPPAYIRPSAPARRSIHDLTEGLDAYGRPIYIETRCPHTGKPTLWYKLDKKGQKRRFTRDTLGIQVEHLDAGPFI